MVCREYIVAGDYTGSFEAVWILRRLFVGPESAGWFAERHGFGDSSEPLLESVKLVEDIVVQQIKCVFHRAAEVAMLRGSKAVSIEDVLFLMRKNKFKLGRLVRYLELKSLQGYVYTMIPRDDEDATAASLASVESGRKGKTRFREWVMKDIDTDMKLAPSVLDVFNYMAYETVAQIVDLALLVKKESKHNPSDPLSWSMPPLVGNPGFPSTQLFSFQDKPWLQGSDAAASKSGDGTKKALLPV
ncbi:hypothetical protein HPB50_022389 [Hyalomma asiaticum]|uniref:Uncharacterized protein n=1 Tax=Hyalomma asiaticum TaxID=266040 RepID=A0ACB7S1E6_HYAAI|nr:hypothetical protein HPB50_022389 [Hyalomma asiaticum]